MVMCHSDAYARYPQRRLRATAVQRTIECTNTLTCRVEPVPHGGVLGEGGLVVRGGVAGVPAQPHTVDGLIDRLNDSYSSFRCL